MCHSSESLQSLAPDRARSSRLIASRRVAEHLGMRAERTALVDDDYPAVVYAAELPRRHN